MMGIKFRKSDINRTSINLELIGMKVQALSSEFKKGDFDIKGFSNTLSELSSEIRKINIDYMDYALKAMRKKKEKVN